MGGSGGITKAPAELQTTFLGNKHFTIVSRSDTSTLADKIKHVKLYASFNMLSPTGKSKPIFSFI